MFILSLATMRKSHEVYHLSRPEFSSDAGITYEKPETYIADYVKMPVVKVKSRLSGNITAESWQPYLP
jgi:hypothetical protein